MTTDFGFGIQLLKDVFMNTQLFGNYWIFQLMILFGTLLVITRVWKDWGDIALPVVTGWHIIGFKFNYVIFVITGMIFVINAISMKEIVGGITAGYEGITQGIKGIGRKARVSKAYDNRINKMKKEIEYRKKLTPLMEEKLLKQRFKLGDYELEKLRGKNVTERIKINELPFTKKTLSRLKDDELTALWNTELLKKKKKIKLLKEWEG